MAQIAMREDLLLQTALKEEVSTIKESFWPRLLELASENDHQAVHLKKTLFRGALKKIQQALRLLPLNFLRNEVQLQLP